MANESVYKSAETGGRWYRNFNAAFALGYFALGSVLTNPVAVTAANGLGVFNSIQAGAGELARRWGKKKRTQN